MATIVLDGKDYPSGARLLSLHGKKAQIAVGNRTRHVLETRREWIYEGPVFTSDTYFRTADGQEFGFTSREVQAAIFRS